jgi:cyanophycinase
LRLALSPEPRAPSRFAGGAPASSDGGAVEKKLGARGSVLKATCVVALVSSCQLGPTTDFHWFADAGNQQASDAGLDAGFDAGTVTATVFPRVGASTDSVSVLQGPGLVLMGGGSDVDSAFSWMRGTLAPGAGRLGDVVVLRASGSNAYDSYIYGLAPFNSVQTVLLPPPSTLADLQLAASLIDGAEAVWFAGGDQSRYAAWSGSVLMAAVQRVYQRGGVVGGTSAGLAMLGQFAYDARVGSVTSSEALADPFRADVTFTRGALAFPLLADVVTDSHFAPRDRFGRLTAFMARQVADGAASTVLGIGVDEATALLVDKTGRATLVRQGASVGAAYFVTGAAAAQCSPGQPLVYPGLTVTRLEGSAQFYDLTRRCGTGPQYPLSGDGRVANPFGATNPYAATAAAGTCP